MGLLFCRHSTPACHLQAFQIVNAARCCTTTKLTCHCQHASEDDAKQMSQTTTQAQWAALKTQAAKEDHWLATKGYNYDPRLHGVIPDTHEALRVYTPMLHSKPMKYRALARRAWLAAKKGGHCQVAHLKEIRPELPRELPDCAERIRDYRFLRLWEFNHVIPRSHMDGQFVICGTDASNRNWHTVRDHCLTDTVLLCRECHYRVSEFEKEVDILANRTATALIAQYGST